MTEIIQLKRGSYKGVDLTFVESTTTGGNRLIKFQYPGSDNQSIERQGKAQRAFALTLWLPHTNYYAVREETLRVLDDGVKGTFVHPTFGAIENVITGRYTLTERSSELGRASILVTFEIDDGDGIPIQSGALAAQVVSQADELNTTLDADLAARYQVTPAFTGNYTDAVENIRSLVPAVEKAIDSTTPTIDSAAEVATMLRRLTTDATALALAPIKLANRVSDIFVSLDTFVTDSVTEVGAIYSRLFGFGSDDPVAVPTTVGLAERASNRQALRATVRTKALVSAYTNYSQAEFTNADELTRVLQLLEARYMVCWPDPALSAEAIEQLTRLRTTAQAVFDAAKVGAQSVTQIVVSTPTPLSILTYQYYGTTELVDTLADLNDVEQNAFIKGTFRILAE
jgi:prophage DNA circulation protein